MLVLAISWRFSKQFGCALGHGLWAQPGGYAGIDQSGAGMSDPGDMNLADAPVKVAQFDEAAPARSCATFVKGIASRR